MRPATRALRSVALLLLFGLCLGCGIGVRPAPVAACVPAPTLAPGAARPPSPTTPTVAQAAAAAEVIFRGHPIRRQDVSYKFIDMPTYRTTFAIETLWKGPPATEVSVLTFDCGPNANPFAADGTYIIYARTGLNGELVPIGGISRHAQGNDPEDTVLGPSTATLTIAPTPSPAPSPTASPLSTATPIATATAAPAGTRSELSPRVLPLIAGGAGIVAGGALVGLLLGRRRSACG